MSDLRSKKILFAAAVLLLAAFCAAVLHLHADGHSEHECPVCRFISQVISLLPAVLIFLAGLKAFFRYRGESPAFILCSRFLPALPKRGPPALSL